MPLRRVTCRCMAASFPHDALPFRAFPSRVAGTASPLLHCPLAVTRCEPGPATRPCSTRESVASPTVAGEPRPLLSWAFPSEAPACPLLHPSSEPTRLRQRPRRGLTRQAPCGHRLHPTPKGGTFGPAPKCGHRSSSSQPHQATHLRRGRRCDKRAAHSGRSHTCAPHRVRRPDMPSAPGRSLRAAGAPPKRDWRDPRGRVAPSYGLVSDTGVRLSSPTGSLSRTTVYAAAPKNRVLTGLCQLPGVFPTVARLRNALRV